MTPSTTGRSTKLIHGGIRYLEAAFKNLDLESYRLVEEALEERAYMLQVRASNGVYATGLAPEF